SETFLLKFSVPYGENLVDDQNFRFQVSSNRKTQPHIHTRGISLNRGVKEAFHSGEIDDGIKRFFYFVPGHSQYRSVQVDVLTAGQFGVESGSYFQQTGDPPLNVDLPGCRLG